MLIPSNVFKLSGAASTDKTRYQLCGVHFKRTGERSVSATATNGKILVTSKWEEADPSEYPAARFGESFRVEGKEGFKTTIPAASCKVAEKLAPSKVYRPILANVAMDEHSANGTVHLGGTDLGRDNQISVASEEAQYPDTDRVWPTEAPSCKFLVNSSLLIQLLKTIEGVHGKDKTIEVQIVDHEHPVVFEPRSNDGITSKGMIMPIPYK